MRFSNTTGIMQKKKTMWFIGVEVEQETSAPPPKKKILDPPLDMVKTLPSFFIYQASQIARLSDSRDITKIKQAK